MSLNNINKDEYIKLHLTELQSLISETTFCWRFNSRPHDVLEEVRTISELCGYDLFESLFHPSGDSWLWWVTVWRRRPSEDIYTGANALIDIGERNCLYFILHSMRGNRNDSLSSKMNSKDTRLSIVS